MLGQRRRRSRNKRNQNIEHMVFDRTDVWLCVLLMIISAIMTLINLGDARFPASAFRGAEEQPVWVVLSRTVFLVIFIIVDS